MLRRLYLEPVPLATITPRPLTRLKAPFADPHWLFEVKWDGFRALAYIERHGTRLVSRNGNDFKIFHDLCRGLADALHRRGTILDGEIVCLDNQGRTQFRDLLFRRGTARFYAFDLLFLNGKDLRLLPLIERKLRLRELVPLRHPFFTLSTMASLCSTRRAVTIWKASLRSEETARTCREPSPIG
jgi:bifunctional non-homologous end joining protein LigD